MHCSGIAQSVGFGAAARGDARVLVLGSLPGQISLQQGEYYANPHNAFWKIMEKLFGAPRDMPYAARLRRLNESGIALWDVCASGQRPGSPDSKLSNIVANDFGSFFSSHPSIGLVCFNGATAAKLYSRKVLPWLADRDAAIRRVVLPSTSPAHAAMPLERKLNRWREVLLPALEPTLGRYSYSSHQMSRSDADKGGL